MKRAIFRATTAVAAVSAAALFFPAVASAAPVSATNCAKVSSANAPNGWGNPFGEELPGKHSGTSIPGVDRDGSLEFVTNNSISRQASYHTGGGVPLADVVKNDLTFQKTAGNANWQIRVNGANTGVDGENGFATFVWVAPNSEGKPEAKASDQWWATRDLPGIPRGQKDTLANLQGAANSEGAKATVTDYGISSQPGGTADATVNVDNVQFNGCTTNFALKSTGNSGSLGGFGLGNLIPGLS